MITTIRRWWRQWRQPWEDMTIQWPESGAWVQVCRARWPGDRPVPVWSGYDTNGRHQLQVRTKRAWFWQVNVLPQPDPRRYPLLPRT